MAIVGRCGVEVTVRERGVWKRQVCRFREREKKWHPGFLHAGYFADERDRVSHIVDVSHCFPCTRRYHMPF